MIWRPHRHTTLLAATTTNVLWLVGTFSVVNIGFLLWAKSVGSGHNGLILLAWLIAQCLTCLLFGWIQHVRGSSLKAAQIVSAIGAGVLAVAVLIVVNPGASSTDCPSSGPCDTSFGV